MLVLPAPKASHLLVIRRDDASLYWGYRALFYGTIRYGRYGTERLCTSPYGTGTVPYGTVHVPYGTDTVPSEMCHTHVFQNYFQVYLNVYRVYHNT